MTDLNQLALASQVKKRIKEWLGDEYDPDTRSVIRKLIREKNEKELLDRFFTDLEFGTGGLRGIMDAGSNRMNCYVVAKATQGLANYLRKKYKKDLSAVVAYDSRNHSKEFALKAALIFAGNNIKTYLFESLRPTPLLSFSVRHLGARSGIVITASHNPPEYNGYKVFAKDGGQIVSPEDKDIIKEVRKISHLSSVKELSEKEALKKGLLLSIGEQVDQAYQKEVSSLSLEPEIIRRVSDALKIVYTPLHGSGNIPVRNALSRFGFKNVLVVKEQELPDGNFPTVKSPNPEEPATLEMGLKLCREREADILLATDPDSDRLGTAVRNKKGEYELLTGNQIVSLLTYYILSRLKEKKKLLPNGLIIKTIVTTDLMKSIADDFHVKTLEVLTGFKYIGEQIKVQEERKRKGKPFLQYIFGGEESYGMLAGTFVRDKDAVSASCLFAEMAGFLKAEGRTVLDYLDEIYLRYGYFKETLKSVTLKGIEGISRIKGIMETFRKKPPLEISGLRLRRIGDLKCRELRDVPTGKVEQKYHLPLSDVIILFLEKGVKITMRPSGTEPKIKFYFSIVSEKSDNLELTKKEVDRKIDSLKDDFLKVVEGIIALF